jgi:hypothetical protein
MDESRQRLNRFGNLFYWLFWGVASISYAIYGIVRSEIFIPILKNGQGHRYYFEGIEYPLAISFCIGSGAYFLWRAYGYWVSKT